MHSKSPRAQLREGRAKHARLGKAVAACAESLESRLMLSTVTWSATGGGAWSTASDWSGGAVPQAGDTVVINQPVTVTIATGQNISISSLSVSSGSLVMQSGSTLTTAGAVTNAGSITVNTSSQLNVGGSYTASAGATLSLPGGQPGAISSNYLGNTGFESPAVSSSGTTSPSNWSSYGSAYVSKQYAYLGSQSLQTSGSNSGVLENVPVTPGNSYTISVYAMTPAADPLTGGEAAYLEMVFLTASGTTDSPSDSVVVLTSASTPGGPLAGSVGNQGWNFYTTSAVAPANAVSVFAILQSGVYYGSGGGSVYWDDAELGPSATGRSKLAAASVSNSGTLLVGPDNSVTTTGGFTQTTTATLDIQLGGTPVSQEYGSLNSAGPASLAGTLQSGIVDGYIPGTTDQFTVMEYPSETGTFSNYNLASGTAAQFQGAATFTYVMLAAEPTSALTTTVNAASNLHPAYPNILGVALNYGDVDSDTPQTEQMLQAAGLTIYRFPSDSSGADYHFNMAAQNTDANAQTIPQFVQMISAVGGTGMLTTDYGSGSPQEAAAELAYLMGSPSDTTSLGTGIEWNDTTNVWQNVNWGTVGYWASLRGAAPLATDDGLNFLRLDHPAPFTNIKYWEIGDEEYGGWETDHHGTAGPGGVSTGASHDPTTYAEYCATFAVAAAEITSFAGLPAISIGIDSDDPTGATDGNWTATVLRVGASAGFVPGFISDHDYPQNPGTENDNYLLNGTVSNPNSSLDYSVRYSQYEALLDDYLTSSQAAGVTIMDTEYSSVTSYPGKQSTSLVDGLFVANTLGSLLDSGYTAGILFQSRGGWDTAGNDSEALYGWREGGDYGILGDPDYTYGAATQAYIAYPNYYAEQLGSKIITAGAEVESATSNYQDLDTYAVMEPDGHLDLLVINTNPAGSLNEQFNLSNFTPSGAATFYQYGEAQDTAQSKTTNGASALATFSTTVSLSGSSFSYSFPAYSMTVIDLSPKTAAPPVVSLTAPPSGSSTNNNKPTFSGVAETAAGDSPTVTVDIYSGSSAGGTPVQTLSAAWNSSTGTYSVAASAALVDGTYTAQASESNTTSGQTGYSAADTFTVDTTPPVVTLTAPVSGSSTGIATPTFAGAAGTATGDLPAITIDIYNGASATGTAVQTLTTTASSGAYSIVDPTALPGGTYTAQASQSDAAGNTGASAPDTFTINTTDSVSVAATDASATVGATPPDTGSWTFTRTGPTTAALPVSFALSGSAVEGTDYSLASTSALSATATGGTITIAAGVTTATLTLTPLATGGGKSATLTLSSGSYTIATAAGATITIASATTVTTPSLTLTDLDIGGSSPAGSASVANGVYTVSGGGADIYGTSDQFNFDYTTVSGNTTAIVQVNSQTNTNSWAKAGLMFRDSTAAGGEEFSIVATPGNGVELNWRLNDGSATTYTTVLGPAAVVPCWLEITRVGNVFTAYYSTQATTTEASVTWTKLASSQTIAMPTSALAGLAVTAHNTATRSTATFANLSISGSTSAPVTVPAAPTLTAVSATGAVSLSWGTVAGATSYDLYRSTVSGGEGTTPYLTGLTGTTYTDSAVTSGTYYYTLTAVDSAGQSQPSKEASAAPTASAPTNGTLADANIGSPGKSGSASYNSSTGVWTVSGGGADIYGTSDQFNFASTSVSGNATLTTEVTSLTDTDPWAKAGLMFRDGAGAGAANVAVVATPGAGVSFQYRTTAGGSSTYTNVAVPAPTTSAPVWLKLVRSGNVFTASYSTNGTTYKVVGTVTITLDTSLLAGLAVTAHNNSLLATATFANVST